MSKGSRGGGHMPRRTQVHRWVLAYSIVLFGIAAADAGDISFFYRLAGTWNNDATGENIKIERAPIGWDIWISNSGLARLSDASIEGSNLKVEGRGFACFYYVTVTSAQKANWSLRKGEPDAACLTGQFSRVEWIEHGRSRRSALRHARTDAIVDGLASLSPDATAGVDGSPSCRVGAAAVLGGFPIWNTARLNQKDAEQNNERPGREATLSPLGGLDRHRFRQTRRTAIFGTCRGLLCPLENFIEHVAEKVEPGLRGSKGRTGHALRL
jgi:hypothetical protein